MESFGDKLTRFFIVSSKLKAIEADAFEFSPKLEQVWLQGNQITHVGTGTFDKLGKLTVLKFNGNSCHSGSALKRNNVVNLIEQIESKCKDTPNTVSSQNESSTSSQQNEEVEKLKLELKTLKEQILRLKTENKNLKEELEGLKRLKN